MEECVGVSDKEQVETPVEDVGEGAQLHLHQLLGNFQLKTGRLFNGLLSTGGFGIHRRSRQRVYLTVCNVIIQLTNNVHTRYTYYKYEKFGYSISLKNLVILNENNDADLTQNKFIHMHSKSRCHES